MDNRAKKKLQKAEQYTIKGSLLLVLAVFLISIILCVIMPRSHDVTNLGSGWTDSGKNPFSLSEFGSYDGERMLAQRVYQTITVESADTAILFRCRNCYCNVYVDGQLVYTDQESNRRLFGKSPGSRWHVVSLNSSEEPVELCLEVTACYSNSHGLIDNFFMGHTENVYRKAVSSRLPGFLISTFLLLVGIVIIVLYIYLKRHYNANRDLLYLGLATFFTSLWLSTESILWQLFLDYSEMFHMVGYIALAAIPLSFGMLAAYRLKGKRRTFCKIYSVVCAVNLIVITLLHITGLREFHYTLTPTHILIVILIPVVVMIVLSYGDKGEKGEDRPKNLLALVLLAVVIACIALSLFQYLRGSYASYSVYVQIALICLLVCLIIYQFNQMAATFSKGLKADMLHDMALTDHMTGLYNRAGLNEHRSEYNYVIDSFSPLGIVQFDVNNLKKVNDTLGHEKGDQLIMAAAEGLSLAFPAQEGCKIYRTGGDEFLVVIRSADPEVVYNDGIEVLQEYCDKQNVRTDLGFKLYIAHGFVLVKGNKALDEAIDEADALMYENKRELKARGC